MTDTVTKGLVPKDRLTRICDTMLETFRTHGEIRDDDRAIVMIVGGDDSKGGIGMSGYDEDGSEALADLVMHLRAIFRARGQELHFLPVGATPPKDRA